MSHLNLEDIGIILYSIKIYSIIVFTYYFALKSINEKYKKKNLIVYIILIAVAILCSIIKYQSNSFNSIIFLITIITILFSKFEKKEIGYSIIIIIFSLSINYIVFFISTITCFFLNILLSIRDNYISLIFIILEYILIITSIFKIKKYRKGFQFLKSCDKNEYINMLILNISIIIIFSSIIISNYNYILTHRIFWALVTFCIIMFITIQKSLQLYYKQKLQQRELEDMRKELTKKNQEIKELEKENLNLSKTNHSISHKQKSLEYKLNQLILKNEIADEIDIKDRLSNISKELINNNTSTELKKTNITEIDDMLKYMQSECINNKIEFELQLNGNIHHMVNKYISKENLEILIADHIKNAIIAIKHSNNINRNILIRLGIIDGIYSIYIYDSGIEFEIETLLNLGKKPSTTHADTGGTGMGFMNTFDSLNKYKASIIIKEYGKPCKDNYTKSIQIKFDNKNQFIICSYRAEEIKEKSVDNSEILILKEE